MSTTRLPAEERRASLLNTACGLFASRSYHGTTTADIARAAGVTEPVLYRHFPSKRDLYLAVVADLAAGLPEMVDTDLPDLALEDLIARNMARFLDAFERNHEVLTMLLGGEGGLGRDPEVEAIMSGARDRIVMRMAYNHAGDDPSPELLLALRVFQGTAEAAAKEWLRYGRATRAEVETLLTRTLLALIGDLSQR